MKIAIIGCGITGMSAGITLQKNGIDTVIFEKAAIPGGVIGVYKKENILINNALEFVFGTAKNTFANDMWQNLGMFKQSPKQKDCFSTFIWDNHSVGIYKDFDKTVNELISLGEKDKKKIIRLGKAVEKFKKIELPLITSYSDNVLHRLIKVFFSGITVIPEVLTYGMISCKEFSKRMKSPALKAFFSEALNCDRGVLQYIVLWAFFSSGNFGVPNNNQKEMTQSLYDNYLNLGGKVIFNKELTDVAVKNKRICELNFSDDSVSDFDYVIFSNDIAAVNSVMKCSKQNFPALEKIIKKEHVTGSCILYFTIDREYIKNIRDNVKIETVPIKVGSRSLNSFTVRIQENTEAEKAAVSVTLYQNEADFYEWQKIFNESYEKYKREKNRIARSIIATIEQHIPSVQGKLTPCDIATPMTYYRRIGVNCGGWMPESWNPRIYLYYGRGHMPGIKNASIAGQKVFPIGGTTFGAFSGVKLAERLVKLKNKNRL